MGAAAASVREVTTTAFLEAKVADASGTKAAASRAEAARAKGWPTLVK
jgi:hypothetical protein